MDLKSIDFQNKAIGQGFKDVVSASIEGEEFVSLVSRSCDPAMVDSYHSSDIIRNS